jgi:predicted RNase H-like HicB family nuclease
MNRNKINYDYLVWKEGKYYVSQCINVNVSSFGDTVEEALSNLREAVELYFEDEDIEPLEIDQLMLGREMLHV